MWPHAGPSNVGTNPMPFRPPYDPRNPSSSWSPPFANEWQAGFPPLLHGNPSMAVGPHRPRPSQPQPWSNPAIAPPLQNLGPPASMYRTLSPPLWSQQRSRDDLVRELAIEIENLRMKDDHEGISNHFRAQTMNTYTPTSNVVNFRPLQPCPPHLQRSLSQPAYFQQDELSSLDPRMSSHVQAVPPPTSTELPNHGKLPLAPSSQEIHPEWSGIIPPQNTPYHPRRFLAIQNAVFNRRIPIAIVNPHTGAQVLGKTGGNIRQQGPSRSGEYPADPSMVSTPSARPDMLTSAHLNKYAPTYIPQWLLDIPPTESVGFLPPLGEQPANDYATKFLPLGLLTEPLPDVHKYPSILSMPPYDPRLPIPMLEDDGMAYLRHWTALLSLELTSLQAAATQQKLFEISVEKYEPTNNLATPRHRRKTWKVLIPGIREDTPRIQTGDILVLRGLYPELKTADKRAIQARIAGHVKRDGVIFVESPEMESHANFLPRDEKGQVRWVVEFKASSEATCIMHNAIRGIAGHYEAAQRESPSALSPRAISKRWLFPELQDISHTSEAMMGNIQQLYDSTLNREQREAVMSVVEGRHRVPYIISGPPGTGKTKTIVEAVLQLVRTKLDSYILLCAPSDPATDTLAKRLAAHLGVGEMLRLQNQTRTFAEVPDELLPYSFILNDRFACPEWNALLRFRVVVVSCLDAGLLQKARLTNTELMRVETLILRGLHPEAPYHTRPHWTHLLIDEAGQASEPESVVPISVVLPSLPHGVDAGQSVEPQLVLCGDIHQLGPIIASQRAREGDLDMSLLERLSMREPYAAPSSIRGLRDTSLGHLRPITWLLSNYRSHPGILLLPSTLFYEDTLEPKADTPLLTWGGMLNPKLPVVIKGIEAAEDWVEEGASYFNEEEIKEVVHIVKSLQEQTRCRPEDIGVITPWREQVWRLREVLRQAGHSRVNVGNVEAYQGAEYRFIILSCVRSSRMFLQNDRETGLGLIYEPKRFNVAITRAKELLVIVGNMNCHKIDPYWQALLTTALRHGLYDGPELGLPITGDYISRLETRYYPDMTNNEGKGASDGGMVVSGSVAREALRVG